MILGENIEYRQSDTFLISHSLISQWIIITIIIICATLQMEVCVPEVTQAKNFVPHVGARTRVQHLERGKVPLDKIRLEDIILSDEKGHFGYMGRAKT